MKKLSASEQYDSKPNEFFLGPLEDFTKKEIVEFKDKKIQYLKRNKLAENADIMRYIGRCIFKDKPEIKNSPIELHIAATREYVQTVLELTPAQYAAKYSTRFNIQVGLANPIRRILDESPTKVKEKCFFHNKSIVFYQVFPEYYESIPDKPTYADIFFAKTDLKANLTMAAKNPTFLNEVTEILHKAINAQLDLSLGMEATIEERMRMIVNPAFSRTAIGKDFSSEGKKPPIIELVETLGLYSNVLDFYMLNLSLEDQVNNVDAFMRIRREAGYAEMGALNRVYEAFKENRTSYDTIIFNSHKYTRTAEIRRERESLPNKEEREKIFQPYHKSFENPERDRAHVKATEDPKFEFRWRE